MNNKIQAASELTQQKDSVKSALWELRPIEDRALITATQKTELPEILARIMLARGMEIDEFDNFLSPTLKASIPDPFSLLDMNKAAQRLADAVEKGEEIAVFGDYDVDGATSSALLKRYFRMLDNEPVIYIPDRIDEGYGPNTEALLYLKEHGIDICITVDCGTLSFEPLAAATAAGLEMIVVDHHLSAETLPDAYAIVNPNRLDETTDLKHLAAVGVSFMLCVAINSVLRQRGWFTDRKEPNLLSLLDIVALGTVCDVVPLKGLNRAFVSQGLRVMRGRNNVGMTALADVAGLDDVPQTYHLGFALGPRINAGGRVGKSDLGARLLSTDDVDEAYQIAGELDKFNAERRAIESLVFETALAQVENSDLEAPVIFAVGEGWHPGVVGIVASRITERFNRPTAIITINNGIGKASARSVTGIDFGSAIVAASQSGLLLAGGGHAMAAGFTVEKDKIDQLHQFLCERFSENIDECAIRKIKVDGYLSVDAATMEFAESLQMLEPYGTANPEPRFVFSDMFVIRADIVGADHIKCILGSGRSGGVGKSIKAMAYRSLETPVGKALLDSRGKTIDIVGKLKINSWRGADTVEILIDDVAV